MKDSYTLQEISNIAQFNRRTLTRRAQRESWGFQEVKSPGRNGKTRVYPFATLPADVRKAIELAEARAILAAPPVLPAVMTPALPRLHALAHQAVPPDHIRAEALAKFAIVQAFIAWKDNAPWGQRAQATDAFLLAYNAGQELPAVRAQLGEVSSKSLYAWDKILRDNKHDYLALCPQRGGWVAGREPEPGQIGPDAEKLFLNLWLRDNRPSIKLAARSAAQMMSNAGKTPPSYFSFYRFAKRFELKNKSIVRLARYGEKALNDLDLPYLSRDWSMLEVGDVLIADGHDLNFQVIHPYTGKPARLKLIAFIDARSRYPVGAVIMPTESSISISMALYDAIKRLGKYPRAVLLDNGKAFKAKVFTNTDIDLHELQGVYARLGIATVFALPYHAQSKAPIERWFGTLNEQCERLLTYVGRSIDDKPAHLRPNEIWHQAAQRTRSRGHIPDIFEATDLLNLYFGWYAEQPHRGLGGRTPREVFESGRGPGFDGQALADLHWDFLHRHKFTPRNCRFVFNGVEYMSDGLLDIAHECLALFDLSDARTAHIYTTRGQFLCEAMPVMAVHPLAEMFGDTASLDRIRAGWASHKAAKRKAIEGLRKVLGSGAGEYIDAIDWDRREAVMSAPDMSRPVLPESALVSESRPVDVEPAVERIREMPTVAEEPIHPRPQYFRSESERYEWCFRHVEEHGLSLSESDAAFAAQYETTPEYRADQSYFDDRRDLWRKKKVA